MLMMTSPQQEVRDEDFPPNQTTILLVVESITVPHIIIIEFP